MALSFKGSGGSLIFWFLLLWSLSTWKSGGKRSDGATTLSFARRMEMAWDVKVSHTCASAYTSSSASCARAAAGLADSRKNTKSRLLPAVYFRPVGLETLGSFGPSALALFNEISNRIRAITGRRLASATTLRNLQRFRSGMLRASLRRTLTDTDCSLLFPLLRQLYH